MIQSALGKPGYITFDNDTAQRKETRRFDFPKNMPV
jgi:hypothetical protein